MLALSLSSNVTPSHHPTNIPILIHAIVQLELLALPRLHALHLHLDVLALPRCLLRLTPLSLAHVSRQRVHLLVVQRHVLRTPALRRAVPLQRDALAHRLLLQRVHTCARERPPPLHLLRLVLVRTRLHAHQLLAVLHAARFYSSPSTLSPTVEAQHRVHRVPRRLLVVALEVLRLTADTTHSPPPRSRSSCRSRRGTPPTRLPPPAPACPCASAARARTTARCAPPSSTCTPSSSRA